MKKGNSGFTLLEVMLAMSIIAIALTAVLHMQSQSLSLASEARFYTTAPLLAQSRMSVIMAAAPETPGSDSGDFGEDFPDYTWRSTVEELETDDTRELPVAMRKIDVDVIWNDSEAFQYKLTFYRYFPETE